MSDAQTLGCVPAPAFQHGDGCDGSRRLTWIIGRQGDRLWRCPTCRRFAVEAKAEGTAGTSEPRNPYPHEGSPYRCRDHQDIPVNAKGHGCPPCARARQAAAHAKAARDQTTEDRRDRIDSDHQ